jgi:hypothetical protein
MAKLWSHSAAQRGCWLPSQRVLEVEGLGRGRMVVQGGKWLLSEVEPEGCEEDLIAWATDEQEALSRRYGSGALLLLPLRSGRLAVFGPDRQLIELRSEAPSLQDLRDWSEEGEARSRARREVETRAQVREAILEEDSGL